MSEDKERKIKAIIEELERLCPKTGAKNSTEMLDGFVRIIKSHHGQGDAWLVSVGADERAVHEEVLRDRPELAEFYYRLLSLGVQSPIQDDEEGREDALQDAWESSSFCPEELRGVPYKSSVSPAPDENGLLPCPFCGGKAEISERPVGMAGMHMGEVWRVYCPSCGIATQENSNHLEEAIGLWNTRAHAPSAGKDQEIERWRNACHEHESKKLAMKSKADKRISELKEKTSKLIEALEKISATCESLGNPPKIFGLSPSIERMGNVAKQALAAYKGKEGGA